MKIYIAGPMTGYENYNRNSFYNAHNRLVLSDHTPLNPATLPDGLTQAQYMDICFAMIRAADAVFLLKGYDKSKGAMAELAYAEKLDLKIYGAMIMTEEMLHPVECYGCGHVYDKSEWENCVLCGCE